MASPICKIYGDTNRAAGEREAFILGAVGPIAHDRSDAVVPRCATEMAGGDWQKLANQGIPLECRDDLSILRARIVRDKSYELLGEAVSKLGKELTRDFVLKKLEDVIKGCKSSKAGVVIFYFGHGKKNTGDWCFQDGFITFRDIAKLYRDHFSGRVLTIVTDCSYSGQWVRECALYLEENSVRPCGHSSVEKRTLLKVYASCRPEEIASTLRFFVRGMYNDKNCGILYFYPDKQLSDPKLAQFKEGYQRSYISDFTELTCGKKIDAACDLSPNYTWQRWRESGRLFLVRGRDRGRPAWHYVLLVDDEETFRNFVEKTQGANAGKETIDVSNFGQVLKSGFGEEPPNEVKDWIERTYHATYC